MSVSVIIGSEGQDGRLLYDQLVAAGESVVGIGRSGVRSHGCEVPPFHGIADAKSVRDLVRETKPVALYYLASFHHSSQENALTDASALMTPSLEVHVTGLLHFLDALKHEAPGCHVFYAASALVFGDGNGSVLQDENTPLRPRCIYGITKTAGIHLCQKHREKDGLPASAGILFNHECHLRQEKFVSKKIINAAVRIKQGRQDQLVLGNLSAQVDWGYAPDYVKAMRAICALPQGDDFVIATGTLHTVQEFVDITFRALGLDSRNHVSQAGQVLTRSRCAMAGDSARLTRATGWKPETGFAQMIESMVQHALQEHIQ